MSSPLIAVAGGTSQLGHGILDALLKDSKFMPFVLSRASSKTPRWLGELGVEVRHVDYLSQKSCWNAMKGVHTVSLILVPCTFVC
jgi:uncharacterized protein YbjT (DUF2867 family)